MKVNKAEITPKCVPISSILLRSCVCARKQPLLEILAEKAASLQEDQIIRI